MAHTVCRGDSPLPQGVRPWGHNGSPTPDASEPPRVKENSQLLSGPWEFGVRVVIQGEGHRGGGLKDERWRDGHHPSPFPRAAAWLLGFCQSKAAFLNGSNSFFYDTMSI